MHVTKISRDYIHTHTYTHSHNAHIHTIFYILLTYRSPPLAMNMTEHCMRVTKTSRDYMEQRFRDNAAGKKTPLQTFKYPGKMDHSTVLCFRLMRYSICLFLLKYKIYILFMSAGVGEWCVHVLAFLSTPTRWTTALCDVLYVL